MNEIAILIPTLRRPHRLAALVNNIHDVTPEGHSIYFMTDDPESFEIIQDLQADVWDDTGEITTWPARINRMYNMTSEPYIFLGSDDSLFYKHWASEALHTMQGLNGVVTVNDKHNPNGTLALISRHYIRTSSGCLDMPNVIIYPGYKHNYSDTELFNTARFRDKWAYCHNSIVEHLHPHAGKSEHDSVYQKGDDWMGEDSDLYHSRMHLWGH